jgi:hypothetical protein
MTSAVARTVVVLLLALCVACDHAPSPSPSAEPLAATETPAAVPPPGPVLEDAPTAGPRILDVQASVERFDPAEGERVAIGFTLEEPAEVELRIYDGRDVLIHASEPTEFREGASSLTWDGRDDDDAIVPPEAYSYVLIARSASGESVHDLTDLTGGEALVVPNATWDAGSSTLNFSLDHAARISVRFGIQDGPYLTTVADWVPRAAGPQSVTWDGWDASKVLQLREHPRLQPSVRAYMLPANTIFVGVPPTTVAFADVDTTVRRIAGPKPAKTRMFFQADQPLESRGDVPVTLTVAGTTEPDDTGAIPVRGVVPVRLDVPPEVKGLVLARRFEPAFFVDGTFVHETEVGFLPLTWQWDTTALNPGEHYLTVNLRGYEGNFGAATVKVVVQPDTAPPSPMPGALP